MPVRITKTSEPLAQNPDLTAPFAESDTFRRLQREMELYLDGRINGGSFLVAGHRGSGKTWVVHKAIERLQFPDQEKGEGAALKRYFPRPFLVRLHGPDLLTVPEDGSGSSDNNTKGPDGRALALHAMSEIGLALHRALCEEVTHSFIEHASLKEDHSDEDAHELAAQFQIELDHSPSPSRLFQFWSLLGRKKEGVLARPQSTPREGWRGLRNPLKQGFRELVALTTAFHLQAEISRRERKADASRESKKPGETKDAARESLWKSFGQFMLSGAKLFNPIFGIVIGVIVFVALMETHVHLSVSLLTAFLSAVSTTILMNFASAQGQKSTFVADDTVASLDRTLPLLVRRVREAGLHPIFVVDELDKVDPLAPRMEEFMRCLKFFVTEQAFFCFLADRSYFDRLMARRRRTPYALEDTYFTEMVFVHYSPKDLLEYLDQLMDQKVDPQDAGPTVENEANDGGPKPIAQ